LLVIGSGDAVWGFALAGVHGRIVKTAEELNAALDEVTASGDVGIVLITENVAGLARQRVNTLIARSIDPLVVEIPGPAGPSPDRPSLSELVRKTTGVKI